MSLSFPSASRGNHVSTSLLSFPQVCPTTTTGNELGIGIGIGLSGVGGVGGAGIGGAGIGVGGVESVGTIAHSDDSASRITSISNGISNGHSNGIGNGISSGHNYGNSHINGSNGDNSVVIHHTLEKTADNYYRVASNGSTGSNGNSNGTNQNKFVV